jgi:transcriptional regulator with XRE-family HTH domain
MCSGYEATTRRNVTLQNSTVGVHLKRVREQRGWSLRDVEKRTDGKLRNGYLSQVETGQIAQPSPAALKRLAEVYDQDYATLLDWAGYSMPKPATFSSQTMSLAYTIDKLSQEEADELRFVIDTWLTLRERDSKAKAAQNTSRKRK